MRSDSVERIFEGKRAWHRRQAKLPLREKVRILLELQRQDLPLIRRHRPLRAWERPWSILPGLAVAVLFLGAMGATAPAPTPTPQGVEAPGEQARVVQVIDGDTLVVRRANGTQDAVRLIGVDTPEAGHRGGPVEYMSDAATAFTREQALNKTVFLVNEAGRPDRDKYGRLLRYVILPDGRTLNAEILRRGYGFVFTRFAFGRMKEFRALEQQARLTGTGLWADNSVPEYAWSQSRGGEGVTIYPMSNKSWGIRYRSWAKLRVRGPELSSVLDALRILMREKDDERLERTLAAQGWVRVTRPR
jgi:micrococcal nuclease